MLLKLPQKTTYRPIKVVTVVKFFKVTKKIESKKKITGKINKISPVHMYHISVIISSVLGRGQGRLWEMVFQTLVLRG